MHRHVQSVSSKLISEITQHILCFVKVFKVPEPLNSVTAKKVNNYKITGLPLFPSISFAIHYFTNYSAVSPT